MQTAIMPASGAMADRILAFGSNLQGRQQEILGHMVSKGRNRMTNSEKQDITAREAEILLNEKAEGNLRNTTGWFFDIWRHSF